MKPSDPERMRYQKNAASFWLCLLAIVADALYFVFLYIGENVRPNAHMGADIIINILFMLVVFLASEKTKTYVLSWSYILFGLAAVQLAHIFYLPFMFYRLTQLPMFGGVSSFFVSLFLLTASALSLAAAGAINVLRAKALRKYLFTLKENV